ncbi:Riboflavin biosynthesis protein RibD [Tetrabaena socialis]|uniref:Riboflavin biosynthesis protein PYRD, chloroplastic n=1 Tax=Tetrabaena socialis TaxID=47790 RepID=A0A2J7ZXW4_9CHLO|nr:Riboflavin biosynthesis protein RibD [Tetrabaena socialis]|eukprot:PNH05106.1 Riboflavin biosynthesis protein RibD [Tetrabaena socialis]
MHPTRLGLAPASRNTRCFVARVKAVTASPPSTASAEDRQHMLHALELAKRALGQTYPNPAVGCVIVKDWKVVGEGFHPKAGMPHAEVYALRGAGTLAQGATAYVTLEPCNHHGRTPPCSRALVDARVARVVVGVGDPNPLVASEGIATLRRAGIEVVVMDGPEREACFQLNKEFMARMQAEATAKMAAPAAKGARV